MTREDQPETTHSQVLAPRRMWVVLLYGWLALLAVQRAIYHHAYLHYDPFAHATFSDGQVYEEAARDILAHAPLGSKPFFLQGAYAYFLAVGLSVRGVLTDALFLQLCLAAFACYCVHYAARRVFDKYDALLSTAMFLAYAGLPFYENKYLSAQLGVTANACVLACFAYLWHARNHTSALLFGLASGLSILARANLVLALPFSLYALWQLAAGRGTQRQLQLCAAAALGLTLALVPMATRNLVVTGSSSILPSHAGGIPFYIGNHAGASGLWNDAGGLISGQVSEERAELATRLGLDPHARNIDQHIGTALYARAFAEIERDPLGWLRLESRKLWLSVGNAELTHDYDALGERELLGDLRPLAIPFGVVLGFGAFGLYAAWRTPYQRLFALMLTGQLLAVLAANLCWFTSAQNRLPLIVPLALATAAFSRWLRRASRTRAVPQSWLVAAVGCMALGAQAYLARPESKRPSSAHYYNLANVEESLGLFEPALKHYQRACERNPKQPMFWLRLAHLARTMQRHAQAHDALDHLAAVPGLPEPFAEAIRDERSALMQASSDH
jgi:tetratricopeptide (TPR) repeat protein